MVTWNLERFGRRLRELREQLGKSQEAMADLIGVDRSYYGGIERGTRNPSIKILFRFCKSTGIKPEEVFSGCNND